jgi:hypothetical protein
MAAERRAAVRAEVTDEAPPPNAAVAQTKLASVRPTEVDLRAWNYRMAALTRGLLTVPPTPRESAEHVAAQTTPSPDLAAWNGRMASLTRGLLAVPREPALRVEPLPSVDLLATQTKSVGKQPVSRAGAVRSATPRRPSEAALQAVGGFFNTPLFNGKPASTGEAKSAAAPKPLPATPRGWPLVKATSKNKPGIEPRAYDVVSTTMQSPAIAPQPALAKPISEASPLPPRKWTIVKLASKPKRAEEPAPGVASASDEPRSAEAEKSEQAHDFVKPLDPDKGPVHRWLLVRQVPQPKRLDESSTDLNDTSNVAQAPVVQPSEPFHRAEPPKLKGVDSLPIRSSAIVQLAPKRKLPDGSTYDLAIAAEPVIASDEAKAANPIQQVAAPAPEVTPAAKRQTVYLARAQLAPDQRAGGNVAQQPDTFLETEIRSALVPLRPLRDLQVNVRPSQGELPPNVAATALIPGAQEPGIPNRGFMGMTYAWVAPGVCHQPDYFEQVNVERYGFTAGPLQPAVSAAHFFMTIPALPYFVGARPMRECNYTLGYYRAGSNIPYQRNRLPISLRGAIFEAGAIAAIVGFLPQPIPH